MRVILDLLILQKEVSSADYSFAKTFSMFLVQIEKKTERKNIWVVLEEKKTVKKRTFR